MHKTTPGVVAAAAAAAALAIVGLSEPAAAGDAWNPGLVAGPVAAEYYGPVYYRERYAYPYAPYAYGDGYRGYLSEDRGYRQIPYGYSLASPSYYDETCRIVREPTPFGWRRLRVCE
jgi:hypothetical protein